MPSREEIIEFLSTYPELYIAAVMGVENAKKEIRSSVGEKRDAAEKDLERSEYILKQIQLRHDEYHALLGYHITPPVEYEKIQQCIQFLETYDQTWAMARRKELSLQQNIDAMDVGTSWADEVRAQQQLFIEAQIAREQLEKKAFAARELLYYANH